MDFADVFNAIDEHMNGMNWTIRGVELTVTGLENEHQAEAAMLHMERLFCAAPIQTQ